MRFSRGIPAITFFALALLQASFVSETALGQPELGLPDLPAPTELEVPGPAEVPLVPALPQELNLESLAPPDEVADSTEGSETASDGFNDGPAPELSTAVTQTPTANFQIPVQKPEQVYGISNGTFTYRVDLDLPPFHGAEPKLSFAYSSSRGTRIGGENQGWLGVGWVLDGLHVIERASPRLGVPTFGAAGAHNPDIYVWNGEPLLLCGQRTGPSPSCSTGGTHFSKVESYLRFTFDSNAWTIAARDGTRYILKPVNAFNNVNPSDPVELRTQYRWLLANIVDTHGNTVTFDYSCPIAPQCYLAKISYTGTEVDFFYETRPDVVSYGTGKSLGKSTSRIKWVRIAHGGALQKWFVLKYQQNAVSNLSRLSEIIPYGDDAAPQGGVMTGSELPKHTFQYNTATTTIHHGPATGISPSPAAVDVDGDGRDDLLTVFDVCGFDPIYKKLVGDQHPFEISESKTVSFNLDCPFDPITEQRLQPHQILFGHFNSDKYIDFVYLFVRFNQDQSYMYLPYKVLSTGTGAWAASSGWPEGSPTGLSDPSEPLLVKDRADGTNTVGTPTLEGTPLAGSDFDGDGLSDSIRFQNGVVQIQYSSGPVVNGPFGQAPLVPPGTLFTDLNGDGLTDITLQGGYGFSELGDNQKQVHLSTGGGFQTLPVQTLHSNLYGPGTADLNGDGRSEIIFGEPNQPDQRSIQAFAALLNSSDNGIYRPDPTWTPTSYGFYSAFGNFGGWVGDFNGDGLSDIVRSSGGAAEIPAGPFDNLLTKVFNGYGGVISITYVPSSEWINERMASVQQTVRRVIVEDGRGQQALRLCRYSGGKYDFRERRFLGFRFETETLPCVSGETQCPTITRELVQELGAIGAVKNEKTRNGAEQILHEIDWTYTTNTSSAGEPLVPYTTRLTQEDTFFYVVANPNPLASTTTTYEYDLYANIVSTKDFGRNFNTGDERVHNVAFAPNTSLYIVDKKRGETWRAGHTTSDPILKHSLYYYDDQPDNLAPPIRGDLTSQKHFVQPGQYTPLEHFEYDSFGNRTKYIDAVDNPPTRWEWDTTYHLYLVKEINAKNQSKTWTRNFHCEQPATETDLNGLTTAFTYDAFCRVTEAARAATGNTITYAYLVFGDPNSQRVRASRPHPNGGNPLHDLQWFDGLGRIWQETKPSSGPSIIVERAFDGRNNKALETFPFYAGETAYTTTFRYDGLNRNILQTNPDGSTRSFVYNVDPRGGTGFGNSTPLESVLTIDELGRPTTIVNDAYGRQLESSRVLLGPGPATTVTEQRRHDLLGRLLGVRDPGGSQWAYTYDLRGLRLTANDPDLGNWIYEYDGAGRLVLQRDALGTETRFSYDELNRVNIKTVQPSSGQNELTDNDYDQFRQGFHNVGHLTFSTRRITGDTIAAVTLDYDGEGYNTKQGWAIGSSLHTVTTDYAPGGEILWKAYPDGDSTGSASQTWQYNPLGRLASVPGLVSSASYAADGQTTAINYPTGNGGVSTTFTYSPERRWLTQISTSAPAGLIQRLDYVRDDIGRIASVASNRSGEDWTYTYDTLDRLTAANNTDGGLDQSFAYAINGNMTSNSRLGAYTYNLPGNARPHAPLTAGQSRSYLYDANGNALRSGNPATNGTQSYTWDGENRLTSVATTGGSTTTFAYGPDGGRVYKATGGAFTVYLGPDLEFSGGVWTKYPIPDAVRAGTTNTWLVRDHSQSIRLRFSGSGTLIESALYRPYGEPLAGPPSALSTSKRYIGERFDADTGLYHLNARNLDPASTRFLSPDWWDPAAA